VCHLNEGHAAFAVLERARALMKSEKMPFKKALAICRAGTLFTTHTAVTAGFDRFSPQLMEQYFAKYAREQLNISLHEMLALGRLNPEDLREPFNMAYLAIRGSCTVNGVSKLHGAVSRYIFAPLFPRWPEPEIPVGSITNGVHAPTWDSVEADRLWTEACGKERWLGTTEHLEGACRLLCDEKIWQMRNASRKALVGYACQRLVQQLKAQGELPPGEEERLKNLLDPHTLTLCFARRFATYKRPNLLLHDQARLLRLLNHPQRPIQLIIAGKAHPADRPGQEMVREWITFIRRHRMQGRVLFLSDYDMLMTEHLVQGADVWINTPRRPWEACGTSGMKVLVNGGLNCSELDGWWAEAYCPEVGWAIGDRKEHGNDPAWDAQEANALYELLENEITPLFYACSSEGIPCEWVKKVRASMSRLTPQFSANRAVIEYVEKQYIPLAKRYKQRLQDQGKVSEKLLGWKQELSSKWSKLRFGEYQVREDQGQHQFHVQLYLNGLDPDSVHVQLYAEGKEGASEVHAMGEGRLLSDGIYAYECSFPARRPSTDYTPRVVPFFEGVSIPLEEHHILWR
jgi:starch phosphorylase